MVRAGNGDEASHETHRRDDGISPPRIDRSPSGGCRCCGRRWCAKVGVPISAASPLVSLIEEAIGAIDTVALFRLAKAGVKVIETTIAASFHAAGRRLAEITLPPGTGGDLRHPRRATVRTGPRVSDSAPSVAAMFAPGRTMSRAGLS